MEASTIGSFMMTTALIVKHPMIFAPIYRFSFGISSDAIISSDMSASPSDMSASPSDMFASHAVVSTIVF